LKSIFFTSIKNQFSFILYFSVFEHSFKFNEIRCWICEIAEKTMGPTNYPLY